MDTKKDISDLIVSTDTMASLLGFTRQRINQLAKDGVLEKQSAGRFPLMKNIQRYIDFLRTGVKDKGDVDDEAQARYWEEKALHERAKRETAELRLAKLKNQLHYSLDVELVMTDMLVTFRNRALSIPDKLAPRVLGLSSMTEISDVIDTELRETLAELSNYEPSMFAGGDENDEDGEVVSENRPEGRAATEVDD